MREKWRTTLRPATSATFSVPSSSSLEMAQRETKPIPSPASTADLIASVESRFIAFLKDLSLKPAWSRAISTTWREPEPCSRIRSLEATNWSRDKRSASKAGGVIKTNSSCMKGSVRSWPFDETDSELVLEEKLYDFASV